VRGEIVAPAAPATPPAEDLDAQVRAAEARAAELRLRAEQTRSGDGPR
jgi:sec-independent protein translocase protein TatA